MIESTKTNVPIQPGQGGQVARTWLVKIRRPTWEMPAWGERVEHEQ